jgi:segregation and condensation protein B
MSTDPKTLPKNTNRLNIEARLEALLFVSATSVSNRQLGDALSITPRVVEKTLEALKETYANRGIRVQTNRGKHQLTTAPELAETVDLFLNLEATTRLSKAALETLSIIAYQQPVTRPQIDSIRGVNSDGVLKNLLSKGVIEEAGRSEGPGRPILYGTTPEFLQHFGLNALQELPPLDLPESDMAEDNAEQAILPLEEES